MEQELFIAELMEAAWKTLTFSKLRANKAARPNSHHYASMRLGP